MTWLTDSRGNKCSVEYFGTKKAAQKALDSLVGCDACTNCSDCSGCTGCTGCSGCSDCSRCTDCFDCSDCFDCFGCSDCSRCTVCSRCSNCSDCFDCSDCSNCSGCSGCSGCSRCTDCSYLKNASLVEQEESAALVVPAIPDIHKAVYAAASRPNSLQMSDVHTCAETHCRAGWVVALAGEAGRRLEERFGWNLAAMKIYDASAPGYKINPCRFYDNNADALADMKKLAEES